MTQPIWSRPPSPESDIGRLNSAIQDAPSYVPPPVPPSPFEGRFSAQAVPRQWMHIPTERPIITQVLLVVLVIIYIPMMLFPDLNDRIVAWGALEKAAIIDGEWWRLITATFLHGGLLHIALNGYALYIIGKELEAFMGRLRFAAIYAVSALAGSVASFIFLPYDAQGVGASGAIFGVFGALAIYYGLNRYLLGGFGRFNFRVIVLVLAANLVLDFVLNATKIVLIDTSAHIGGLIAGALAGFVLCPRYQLGEWRNPLVREVKNTNEGPLPWVATLFISLGVIAIFLLVLLLYRGGYIV